FTGGGCHTAVGTGKAQVGRPQHTRCFGGRAQVVEVLLGPEPVGELEVAPLLLAGPGVLPAAAALVEQGHLDLGLLLSSGTAQEPAVVQATERLPRRRTGGGVGVGGGPHP